MFAVKQHCDNNMAEGEGVVFAKGHSRDFHCIAQATEHCSTESAKSMSTIGSEHA